MHDYRLIPELGPDRDEWLLRWDEQSLQLKDPDGETVIDIETAAAHQLVDLYELYDQRKVGFLTAQGPLVFRKHPAAVEALRELVEDALVEDAEFRDALREHSLQQVGIGLAMFLVAGGLFALYCWWAAIADDPVPGTWLHFVLTWFGWLIHLLLLVLLGLALAGLAVAYYAIRQWQRARRIERLVAQSR
jgi:hypothetical protein